MREKIYINIEEPLLLNDTDKFWMVISGEVNIFYTNVDSNGNYLNPLKHLYKVEKGEIIFSLLSLEKKENTRLIAFSDKASLLSINKEAFFDIDHFFLKNMVNKWIIKTSSALNLNNSPKVYFSLDNYEKTSLNKNTIAFPSQGVSWVELQEGELSIFSGGTIINKDYEIKYPIPVLNKLWIQTLTDKTSIKVLSTSEVIHEEINLLVSLEKLQSYFYELICKTINSFTVQETNLIIEKRIKEENDLNNTLLGIKEIVSGKQNQVKFDYSYKSKSKNPLLNACHLIGNLNGFPIEEPKFTDSKDDNVNNSLYEIARSSKIRIRKVILRDVWWKDENGHLLAFTKKEKQPVVLIQKTSNSYLLKNIATNEEVIVDNEIAQTLEPIAYMFFSGFSNQIKSIKKIVSFAMQGVTLDAKKLIITSLIFSLIGLIMPVLSGIMFDDVIPTADRTIHFQIFIIMIIVGLVTAGLQLTQGLLQMRVETKSSINLQAGVMDYMLRLPVTFYKKYSAGDLTNRVLSINAIRQIVSNTLMTAVLSGVFSFVNLILLFYYDTSLAWIGVLLGVIAVAFTLGIGWFKLKYDRQISENQGSMQGFLFEFLSGIGKIRITGAESRVFTLWAEKFTKLKTIGFNSGNYQNFVEVFNSSFPLLTNIFFFSFLYSTILNSNGTVNMLSVGSFIAFITSFNKFLSDSLRLSMAFITSLNVIPLYERVKPILEAEPESIEGSIDPGELAGEIEMNSVSFRYHNDQPLILKDITFKIKPGEMVAFVGSSGSGKSTIMRLLLGFEQAEIGSIFYDGNSFDTMNKELARRQIGVVLQNGGLMTGSIYQNIVGNSNLTLDEAWEAAKMAGMEEDIKQMPMEMHTHISEGAGTFSGGQRQRLMIARAIAHKPRLLFMDEATSALDNRTQNIVSESLDRLQATRIVIAHRLSTIKNADKIYVLDKGQIVESGNYEDLMTQQGRFYELAKRQIV